MRLLRLGPRKNDYETPSENGGGRSYQLCMSRHGPFNPLRLYADVPLRGGVVVALGTLILSNVVALAKAADMPT